KDGLAYVHKDEIVIPAAAAAGGMVVSGGPQFDAPLGMTAPGTVGSPSTPSYVHPGAPGPGFLGPNQVSQSPSSSRWAALLGGLGLVGRLAAVAKKLFGDDGPLSEKVAAELGGELAEQDFSDTDAAELGGDLVGDDFGDFSGFDFAVGGVVPSAAGGMKVDDGKGGTLAIVHPNEMVLPANL